MQKLIIGILISTCILTMLSCNKDEAYDIYAVPLYAPILESMNMPRPEGSYNYPVIPNTKEWIKLNDREQMVDVCQINKSVVKAMSTQAVIQALWEYPLYADFFAWENTQKGYEFVYEELNVFQELKKRSDAASCLLYRYQRVVEKHKKHAFAHYLLEMHLAQNYFISQLTSDEKKAVVKRALEINTIRQQDPEFTDTFMAIDITFYLVGRIMIHDQYKPFVDKLSIKPGWEKLFTEHAYNFYRSPDEANEFLETIISMANDYIEK